MDRTVRSDVTIVFIETGTGNGHFLYIKIKASTVDGSRSLQPLQSVQIT